MKFFFLPVSVRFVAHHQLSNPFFYQFNFWYDRWMINSCESFQLSAFVRFWCAMRFGSSDAPFYMFPVSLCVLWLCAGRMFGRVGNLHNEREWRGASDIFFLLLRSMYTLVTLLFLIFSFFSNCSSWICGRAQPSQFICNNSQPSANGVWLWRKIKIALTKPKRFIGISMFQCIDWLCNVYECPLSVCVCARECDCAVLCVCVWKSIISLSDV